MVAQLQTTSIAAPGFMGLNTQDSSVSLESGFATVANNCVIDKFGRIGARKGWAAQHTTLAALGNADVKALGELIANDGTSYILAAGNNKLFKLSGGALSEVTYGGAGSTPTITASNWQMCPLNGIMYLYQSGHDPLYFDPAASTTTYKRISEHPSYTGTVQSSNCAISAYGRTWTANTTTNKTTIQFSDLLEGYRLSLGTAGTLDVSQVWPNGADEIIALAAHNNFLYVFGRRQILIYSSPADPFALALYDTISHVGCFARDSVVSTGNDIIFLSDNGIRSLQRVIQERSAPMRDLSANVRDDLVGAVSIETAANIRAGYSDTEAFYVLSLPANGIVYCFDMRTSLQNGASRVTTWDNTVPTSFLAIRDKSFLMGLPGFIGKYSGYTDNNVQFQMKYYTNYFDFGSPTMVKILKKVGVTTVGGGGYNIRLKFGFDFSDIFNSRQFNLANAVIAEYNISEYNINEYGGSVFDNKVINVGGTGRVLQLGFETDINTKALSIQKLDVYVKTGKTR